MVGKCVHGVARSQAALAAPSPVFWPRARACDLKRSPRYALGREHAHGTKILERARKGAHHRGHW